MFQNHAASGHNKLPFVCRSFAACFFLTSTPARKHGEHAETDLLRPRVHRPSRPPRRFAKVQVETDVGRTGLDEWCGSTSGRTAQPLSMGTRDRAYSWSAAGSWPRVRSRRSKARLSLLAGASERAQSRTTAISFSLPGSAPHGSPFSPVVEPDSLCALHNLFCNSTLRAALTGTPARHPHSEMGCARSRCSSWRAANWTFSTFSFLFFTIFQIHDFWNFLRVGESVLKIWLRVHDFIFKFKFNSTLWLHNYLTINISKSIIEFWI